MNALTIEDVKKRLPAYITLDESTYVDVVTKARFIDSEYGEWWVRPYAVFRGSSHPRRSNTIKSNRQKISVNDIKSRLPPHTTLDESTYINTQTKCRFIDSEYGEWWTIPNSIINVGRWHPKRRGTAAAKARTFSVDTVKSKLPSHVTLDESTYVNTHTKARFIDSEYGEWWSMPYNVYSGSQHPKRGLESKISSLRHTVADALLRLPPHITLDESTYVDTCTKARFIDSEYGEWWAVPQSVFNGSGNPKRKSCGFSKGEKDLAEFVKQHVTIEENRRFYYDKHRFFEADIYIPSKNLAIEYNGLYWHSDQQKPKNYHLKKREYFDSQGVRLLQIYENEWRDKRPIVESIILAKLGQSGQKYQARKLDIRPVPNKAAQAFLLENHLMGGYKSAAFVGLYDKDELVSLLGYKKYKGGIDISRFCNKTGCSVAGGYSRLVQAAVDATNPEFVQSYVDLRYGNGKTLEGMGFTLEKVTPGWSWSDCFGVYNRLRCRANMDERGLSEAEHAEELGWFRVYDSGQAKYIKRLRTNHNDT